MLIIAVIWGLLVGNATQLQLKYDHCKSIEFKGEHCELQKKLSEVK